MKTYVTLTAANELKKNLKDQYNKIFKVTKIDDLTEDEKQIYYGYKFSSATDIYVGQTYKTYSKEQKEALQDVFTKINGQKKNDKNVAESLLVLKNAYKEHFKYAEPKWYQVFKRFAYWKETKAIKSFEEMLMKKGIDENTLFEAKFEASVENTRELLGLDNKAPEVALNTEKSPLLMSIGDEENTVNNDFLSKGNTSLVVNNTLDTNILSEKNLADLNICTNV